MSVPLDFYQVLGAETHFLADGIRRAYEARVSKPPQYGFSQDALLSRRQILQAACETLVDPSLRREYNKSLVEDEEGTLLTQVPWDKVLERFGFEIAWYFNSFAFYKHCFDWVRELGFDEFSSVDGVISGFVGSRSFVRVARSGEDRASSSNW